MIIKDIIDEDFTNYKLPSMFIGAAYCDWKCCNEQNLPTSTCQNNPLAKQKNIEVSVKDIYERYRNNNITSAVVLGGLEPMLQFNEVLELIKYFRNMGDESVFVIYTGYYKDELLGYIYELYDYGNIVFKFGRYVPNQEKHYDTVLGVELASNNQYAERIC